MKQITVDEYKELLKKSLEKDISLTKKTKEAVLKRVFNDDAKRTCNWRFFNIAVAPACHLFGIGEMSQKNYYEIYAYLCTKF